MIIYFISISDSAKLVRNINTSTSSIISAIRMTMTFINDFVLFIFLLMFMTTINPVLVLFVVIAIISFIYFIIFRGLLIKYGQFSFEREGESLKRLMQSFSLIKEIKLFNKEKIFFKFF